MNACLLHCWHASKLMPSFFNLNIICCRMAPGAPTGPTESPSPQWKLPKIIMKVLLCLFISQGTILILTEVRTPTHTHTQTSQAHYVNLSWWPTMPQCFPSAAVATAAFLSLLCQFRLVHYRCLQSRCVSPPRHWRQGVRIYGEKGKEREKNGGLLPLVFLPPPARRLISSSAATNVSP